LFHGDELLFRPEFLGDYLENHRRVAASPIIAGKIDWRDYKVFDHCHNLNYMPPLWYLDFQTLAALLLPLYRDEGELILTGLDRLRDTPLASVRTTIWTSHYTRKRS